MQLSIEVLPAPLGPMMENSSPLLTSKLTSLSARTPPNPSDTSRTSSTGVFSTDIPLLLDRADDAIGLDVHPVVGASIKGEAPPT
ncbi:hypothetical protein MCP1_100040 [Candidatus Terasakiella magnetica]|nr:hypothetical protein MCP1_100040 [Candidatus Terasakiella magnetica]